MFSYRSFDCAENTRMWSTALRLGKRMRLWKRLYIAATIVAALFLAFSLL